MNNRQKFTLLLFLVTALAFAGPGSLLAGDPPVTYTPVNSSTCLDLAQTFSWSSDANAVSYRLQISTAIDFGTLIVDTAGIITNSVTRTLPSFATTYYWKVTATFLDNSTATSTVKNFAVKPPAPALSSPANNAACQPLSINMSWSQVTGTLNYRLQVADNPEFSPTLSDRADLTLTSATTILTQYNKRYYWRVKSIQTNCESDWSAVNSLTTVYAPPVKIIPLNDAKSIPMTDTIRWSPIGQPDSFRLQVALDNLFSTGLMDYRTLTDTFKVVDFTQYNRVYYWRVRAYFGACETEWTTATNFRTKYDAPVPSIPSDTAECVSLTRNFVWLASNGATTYRIQVSRHSNFDTLEFQKDSIMGTSVQVKLTAGLTKHYWRVQAKDEANTSEWSRTFWFKSTVQYPVRISPADSVVNQPLSIKFKWNQIIPGATYDLQVSSRIDRPDTILFVEDIDSLTFNTTFPGYYTNYYWRILAHYGDCVSTWSPYWGFKTILEPPTPIFPVNNGVNLPLVIDFKWTAPKGADSYEFHLSKDPSFNTLAEGRVGIEGNDQVITNLQPSTKYYWRVNAVNKEGTSAWSPVYSFNTGVRGPELPLLVSPADKSVKQPVDITFSWLNSLRADKYQIQVSKLAGFQTTVIDNGQLTANTFNAQLDNYTNYYWRVRAINDSGATAWSNVWTFRTIAIAPDEIPQLSTPANNAESLPAEITFRWNDVPRATEYRFQLSKKNDFSAFERDLKTYEAMKYVSSLDYETTYFWRVMGVNEAGQTQWSQVRQFKTGKFTSVNDPAAQQLGLSAVPNPFATGTSISFTLPEASNVELRIYNVSGQEVALLANGMMPSGQQTVNWNAGSLESGVYVASLKIGGKTITFNLVLAK